MCPYAGSVSLIMVATLLDEKTFLPISFNDRDNGLSLPGVGRKVPTVAKINHTMGWEFWVSDLHKVTQAPQTSRSVSLKGFGI